MGVREATPLSGTGTWAAQTMAFNTSLRKLSFPQFQWKWAPVTPKPRPPSGRSRAQAIVCGSPLATACRTALLPLCVPSRRLSEDGRRQVGEDRRHVVRAAQEPHVVVPLVVGGEGLHAAGDLVLGQMLVVGRPVRVHRPVRLEVAAGPFLHVFASLAGGDFDGVVDADQADALFHERRRTRPGVS